MTVLQRVDIIVKGLQGTRKEASDALESVIIDIIDEYKTGGSDE